MRVKPLLSIVKTAADEQMFSTSTAMAMRARGCPGRQAGRDKLDRWAKLASMHGWLSVPPKGRQEARGEFGRLRRVPGLRPVDLINELDHFAVFVKVISVAPVPLYRPAVQGPIRAKGSQCPPADVSADRLGTWYFPRND